MEFASKYGYDYGFAGSDSEEFSDEEDSGAGAGKKVIKRRVRKADSNVISVKFDQLVLTNEMFAGEPIACKKCSAMMTNLSRSHVKADSENAKKFIWRCEFCEVENDLSSKISSLDEVPKKDDVTFLMEAAKTKATAAADAENKTGNVSLDDNYLSFCIDVSGSMDTKIPIKESNSDLVSSSRDSDMSRLDGVKTACVENLKNLNDGEPNKSVSLVTFSDAVKYFGDGTKCNGSHPLKTIGGGRGGYGYVQQAPRMKKGNFIQRIANTLKPATGSQSESDEEESTADLLQNKEKLIAYAHNLDGDLKSIKDTHGNLEQRIKMFRTEGSTALGPALAFTIGFCSKKQGSQIILCTDGCANVGMGSIESNNSPTAEKFYEDLADYAKSQGVTVNVITMEGTDCKIALMGKVADRSNGSISIVNPANLSDQFKSILENRIVATSVKAKLIVNLKYLYIRDEDLEAEEAKAIKNNDEKAKEELNAKKKSVVEKDIGNANIDTEITFEYGIRKLSKDDAKDSKKLKELPFQLQISYTTSDGAKAIRVYTKIQEFTDDRKKAESSLVSDDIVWTNANQKMSKMAVGNNILASKIKSKQMFNFMHVNSLAAPMYIQERALRLNALDHNTKFESLDDKMAEEMYSGAKESRTKMKKKGSK